MMDETAPQLDWTPKVTDIRDPRSFSRTASQEECATITELFGDVECRALRTRYELRPLAPGRYRMSGDVQARIGLICGVTLEPIEQLIDQHFDVEFRRGARRDMELEPDFNALDDDEPEPIVQGLIEAGRFICEVVASEIDPFPRADNVELERSEAGDQQAPRNPFAVLQHLKK